MTQLIRHDLIDIFKVNCLSWGTIGLTQADIVSLNEQIQQTGNSILIVLAVGYTIIKFAKILREMRWEKEDRNQRNNQNEDEQ